MLFLVFLITPWFLEAGSNTLSPAITVFIYDILFERQFSFRTLRPIFISLVFVIVVIGFMNLMMKRTEK